MDILKRELRKDKPNIKVAKKLINEIIDEGGDISPALSVAVSNNHTKIALFLIENGADVNLNVREGFENRSVLLNAVCFNNKSVVRALINKGAKVNICTMNLKETPLIRASQLRYGYDIVKMLVEAGADINAQDAGNFTPFIWAMSDNNKDIARFLFDNGADTMKTCHSGLTGYDWAKKKGHSSVF
jgi:ankyrin repeat protein